MARLSTTEMKLVDSLFGMYSGWVLDFSNNTYAAFFRNDVGVDIYDPKYADYGGSKGKRLWRFLEIEQPGTVAKALTALWDYREATREDRGEAETVANARNRLSTIISNLGGKPLPSGPINEPQPADAPIKAALPNESALASLEEGFLAITRLTEEPQQRGYAFERFLKSWFDVWHLDAHASFSTKSEQIDGSFQHEGATYLVEAKWHTRPINGAMLHGFQGKLLERPDWTRGLFVSYGGFSDESLNAFTARRLILMDGADIYHALHRRIDLGRVIAAKARYHSERRQPFARVIDLFPT